MWNWADAVWNWPAAVRNRPAAGGNRPAAGGDRPAAVRRRTRGDRGETLIELLLAVAIMSIVAVGVYAGLATTVRTSATRKPTTESEATLRAAAERLQDPGTPYVDCADSWSYLDELPDAGDGYTVSTDVRYWQAPSGGASNATLRPTFTSTCPASDAGLQEITVVVEDSTGSTRQVQIVKRRP